MTSKFDPIADAYGGWYDTHKGSDIFQEEIECLRLLFGNVSNPWLEVGLGTGHFAAALNIKHGLDLSLPMAVKALRRDLRVCVRRSEQLIDKNSLFVGRSVENLSFCVKNKMPVCQLRIKSGLFLKDLKFKSGPLKKELSAYLKIIWFQKLLGFLKHAENEI
ncbi:MAG: hypothetical protein ACQEQO_05000 [Thermodesulfobacteriota bacterium]